MTDRKCECCGRPELLVLAGGANKIASGPSARFYCRVCRHAHSLLDVARAARHTPCTGPCSEHGTTCYGCMVRKLAEAVLRRCDTEIEPSGKTSGQGKTRLDLSRATQIVDSWPEWKRNMADQILRPSPQPQTRPTTEIEPSGKTG